MSMSLKNNKIKDVIISAKFAVGGVVGMITTAMGVLSVSRMVYDYFRLD
jgi:hypothetical protein